MKISQQWIILILFGLVNISIFANTPDTSSDTVKSTLDQRVILMYNHLLNNNSYAFLCIPNITKGHTSPSLLYYSLITTGEGLSAGGYSNQLCTEMICGDPNTSPPLYSLFDALHPIILLSAKETTVKIQTL